MYKLSFIRKHCLFILLIILCTSQLGASKIIHAQINHAVNFHLPSYSMCGPYSFKNNYDLEAFRVLNSSHINISNSDYTHRSTVTPGNNELVWTLHNVKTTDLGSYALRIGNRLIQKDGCDTIYEIRDASTSPSSDADWGTWSECDVICGDGRQIRQRSDGSEREQRQCSVQPCEWSRWSKWSNCGGSTCDRTRYRVCWNGQTYQKVNNSQCGTDHEERESCLPEQCGDSKFQWTTWRDWTTCSKSCGPGTRTRSRDCIDERRRNVYVSNCGGYATETGGCGSDECPVGGSGPRLSETSGSSNSGRKEMTVELPVSYIVAGVSVLFILILFVVIAALVFKLRKRRGKENVQSRCKNNGDGIDKKTKAYKERAISMAVSSHCYDEIDDDEFDSYHSNDVKKTERMSVMTVDNTYVALPQSASPTCQYTNQTIWNSVTYNNERPPVFTFGDKPNDSGNDVTSGTGSDNKEEAPRHISVDSVGYLLPGTSEERAIKTKTYTKQ